MAIFGKDSSQQAAGHGTTIIAAGTQFVGDITLSDNLHVDGRVDGDVRSQASVVIGTDGAIEGRIRAEAVVVSGRVHGSIAAHRLEIVSGGGVEGDVHVVDLVIEPGGRFNGSSEIVSQHGAEPESSAGRSVEPDAAATSTRGPASGDDSPSPVPATPREKVSAT